MGKLKVANCTFCGKNTGTMVLLHCLGQVTLATPTGKVISTETVFSDYVLDVWREDG